jgi:hypothetical protein
LTYDKDVVANERLKLKKINVEIKNINPSELK